MTNQPTTPAPETLTSPEQRNAWKFGFSPQAEIWNGRLAMLGFIIAVFVEYFSGQGVLHALGIM
ncbi:chlorophyll a/b-binding protein [Coleofasciculus sp. G2-EDA-02]|uniref:chlorophyll a/b-binding protein n=1 Tax=unclassified Coleofasciculus TaxID=2692782 RepID=UPI0032F21A5F